MSHLIPRCRKATVETKGFDMRIDRIFPVLMMALSIAAAGVYFWQKDWRRGVYWLAAAVLTLMVTIEG